MSLTRILNKEDAKVAMSESDAENEQKIEVYSCKLGKYVSLGRKEAKGDMQKYNIGLGPGNWY